MNCKGKRVAFTGVASGYTRDSIHRAIADSGGTLVNSVSKTTDLLVAGESGSFNGSKRTNAKKLGIPTVSAGDFMAGFHAGDQTWPYGSPRTAAKKQKAATVPKEVKAAITALAANKAMQGFVGF